MRAMDWNSLGKMDQLTPQVQRHLTKVYAALSGALLAAVLGAYYGWKFAVTGVWTQIALFGCILGLSMVQGEIHDRMIVSCELSAVKPCLIAIFRRCVQSAHHFPCRWLPYGMQLESSSGYGRISQSSAYRYCYDGNCHDFYMLLPICNVREASSLPLLGRHAWVRNVDSVHLQVSMRFSSTLLLVIFFNITSCRSSQRRFLTSCPLRVPN